MPIIRWKTQELEKLAEWWRKFRNGEIPEDQLKSEFQGRTLKAINSAAHRSVQGAVRGPGQRLSSDEVQRMIDKYATLSQRLERGEDIPSGARTGWQNFDEITGGARGTILLGGPPNEGKTTFSLELGTRVLTVGGLPLIMFSLEMSDQEIFCKLIAAKARVSEREIRELASLRDEEKKARIQHAIVEMRPLVGRGIYLWTLEFGRISVTRMKRYIEKCMRLSHARSAFVIVDHLQLLPLTSHGLASWEALDNLMGQLATLQRQMGVVLLVISRLSKEGQRTQDLTSFANTMGSAYIVDMAFQLSRKRLESRTANGGSPAALKIVKDRMYGRQQELPFWFFESETRFYEHPTPDGPVPDGASGSQEVGEIIGDGETGLGGVSPEDQEHFEDLLVNPRA